MNDKLERIWKVTAMAYFSVLSWLLTEGIEEKYVNLSHTMSVLAEIKVNTG
jgi:hypothetical protein